MALTSLAVVKKTTHIKSAAADGERANFGTNRRAAQTQAVAQCRPIDAIPAGDVSRTHLTGIGERTAHIEIAVGDREGIHHSADPAAERGPVAPIPARHPIGCHRSGIGECATRINVAAADSEGIHHIPDARAQWKPTLAIPPGHVIGPPPAGEFKIATRIHIGSFRGQRVDGVAHATAQREPVRAIPPRHVERRRISHIGVIAAHENVAAADCDGPRRPVRDAVAQ